MNLSMLRRWGEQSVNRSIFVASVTIVAVTILVKLAGMLKDVLVARQFGTSRELDAYLIAFIIPSFAVSVLAGAFQSSLIPIYIEVREKEGLIAAKSLLASVTARAILLLGGSTAALAILGLVLLPVLGSGFDAPTLALSRSLFVILLPTVLLNGLSLIWGAVLNSDGKFALAALAPAAMPLATLGLLLTVPQASSYALAFGMLIGFALQAIVIGWHLQKRGFSLTPRWRTPHPATGQVMGQYFPVMAGLILASGSELIDQAMATPLGAGSVSVLNYGSKLTGLLLGTGSLAIGTAVLPHFSRMVALRDWSGLRHTLNTYSRLIVAASTAATIFVILFSEPLVRLLFERGAFTAETTQVVSQTQSFYVLQVPFYFLGILGVRLISALKANRLLLYITVVTFTVNILLNLLLSHWFGVAGIALSTSGVYLVSYALVMIALRWRLGRVDR